MEGLAGGAGCGAAEAVAVSPPYTGTVFSLVWHGNLCREGAGTVAGAGRVLFFDTELRIHFT